MDCLDRLPQVGGGRGRGMEDLVDDSTWREVLLINTYALFTGHLSMSLRGLGFLTITWTTVVLLGGFVSALNNKDFWCLTVISLLQTAGVYDVFLTEKLGYINQSAKVFLAVPFSRPEDYDKDDRRTGCFIPQWCAGAVKTLVLSIVLCPLMTLYMFGLLISTGISLWRLIEHDFGDEAHLIRREISTNNAVISTIETVLKGECRECAQQLPEIAVETLLYMPPETKGRFMKIVANMIVDDSKKDSLRKMACENLMGLCIQCTENGEFLQQLLEALTEVIPKIFKEIVPPYGSAGDVMQTSTEGFSSAPGTDVEKGRVWRDDEQHVYKKLSSQPYYLSLCVAIRDTLISAYPHLACQFDELAADICPGEFKSFACLVNEWQLAADTCPVEFKSFACLVNEWQQFVDEKKKKYGGHSTTV